jgi:hypothetical protein
MKLGSEVYDTWWAGDVSKNFFTRSIRLKSVYATSEALET